MLAGEPFAMLDPDDIQALSTMLKKLFQSNNKLAEAARIKQEADEAHAAAWRDFETKRSAFGIFGFDVTDEDLWNKIRGVVGNAAWMEAQRRAVIAEMDIDIALNLDQPEQFELVDGADLQQPEEDMPSGVPPVREVVLAQLTAAADEGMSASQIRQFYEKTYGRELHDKTIGMTLYRLSKDGKTKRFGRTWFITPSGRDGAKNPGVGAPGQSSVFD